MGKRMQTAEMVGLLKRCFPERAKSDAYRRKLREMIHSWGHSR